MASASKEALLDALSLAYLLGVYLSPLPSELAAGRLEPLYVVAVVVAPLLAAYRMARRLRAYAEMARRLRAGGAGEGGARPILRSRAVVEWPVRMKGELYLTPEEICLVRGRGLLRKREEEVICASIEQVKDVGFAGLLSRKIALEIAGGEGGAVVRYEIKVPNPDLWVSRIRELKGAGANG